MPSDGSSTTVTPDRNGGACVVVFARAGLDPELFAAGEIYRDARWTPLSEVIEANKLAAMQSAALSAANAEPTPGGELQALQAAR